MNILEFIYDWTILLAFAVGYYTIAIKAFEFIKWVVKTILKSHRNAKQNQEE